MRLTLFVVVAAYAAGGNDEQEPSDNALGRMSRETASAKPLDLFRLLLQVSGASPHKTMHNLIVPSNARCLAVGLRQSPSCPLAGVRS